MLQGDRRAGGKEFSRGSEDGNVVCEVVNFVEELERIRRRIRARAVKLTLVVKMIVRSRWEVSVLHNARLDIGSTPVVH